MNSTCEHRKTIAEHEVNIIPRSLCENGKNGI